MLVVSRIKESVPVGTKRHHQGRGDSLVWSVQVQAGGYTDQHVGVTQLGNASARISECAVFLSATPRSSITREHLEQ
jgi:hypothetical protein